MSSAIRAMSKRQSRSIVVIAQGQAVGVLTGGDVVQAYATSQEAVGAVRDFMTSSVVTTTPDVSLPEAVDRMLKHEIHRLIVVDPEALGERSGSSPRPTSSPRWPTSGRFGSATLAWADLQRSKGKHASLGDRIA